MDTPYQATSKDVQIFRDWLEKQPFLPHDVEDHYIMSFIMGAKGSIQRAKLTYDNFYKSAHMYPELFEDYDPFSEKAEKFNKTVAYCTVPTSKYNLLITKFLSTDSSTFSIPEYFVKHFHNLQISLWENKTGNCQTVYLVDVTGAHLGHCKTANPIIAEKLMNCVNNANPMRIAGIHLLNMPPLIEWVINMFLQLMPEKLRNRVHLHSNIKSLHKQIPAKYLPADYEGDQKSIEDLYGEQMDMMRRYRDRLMGQKLVREEEMKFRPKDVKTEIGGTFRQLSID